MNPGKRDSQLDLCVPNVERALEQMTIMDGTQSSQPETYLLPLEMWEKVLGKVEDPKDVFACAEVCRNWNSLLQNRIPSAYHQLILPKVLPYLGAADHLNCSAVSKTWNATVDKQLQSLRKTTSDYWYFDILENLPDDLERFPSLKIRTAVEMEEVLSGKAAFGGYQYDNPVAFRHVALLEFSQGVVEDAFDLADDEFNNYCQSLCRFLKRFGKHIHQLELDGFEISHLRIIRMVAICLGHTPNLEHFFVHCGNLIEAYFDNDQEDVDDFLAVNPLPDSTIQKLTMDGIPAKITDLLMERYGNQLECVNGRRLNGQ